MPTVEQLTGATEPNKILGVKLIVLSKAPAVGVLELKTDHGLIRLAINDKFATKLCDVTLQFIDRE